MSVALRDEAAVVVPLEAPIPKSALERVARRVWLRARRHAEWFAHGPNAGKMTWTSFFESDRKAEEDFYRKSPGVQALNRSLEDVDAAIASDETSRLRYLEHLFLLSPPEIDVLHATIAFALVPELASAAGELLRRREQVLPTLGLVARWFGYDMTLSIAAESGLRVWNLVRQDDAPPGVLSCDADLLRWLGGGSLLDGQLLSVGERVPARAPLGGWPVSDVCARLEAHLNDGAPPVRFIVKGLDGSGRKTFAAAVARALGFETLAVDTGAIADADFSAVFTRVLRFSALERTAVVWHGTRLARPWPRTLPLTPLQFIAAEPDESPPPLPAVADEVIVLPPPSSDERAELIRAAVPSAAAWSKSELAELASRHRLTPGDIVRVGSHLPKGSRQASELARAVQRDRLGDLGGLLECPFEWDDLVIGERLKSALSDFTFEARERRAFWQEDGAKRLFPRGRGLIGVLAGPPGTGKTMAAQIIAHELGLDLFRIDLATVIDKYIGETAKNLRRIFARAAQTDAVLLFDEADALFTRRTDVKDSHDRYANADTNYLLQLLEDYSGVALLATNKFGNMDTAFVRRLRYLFVFPRPDAEERFAIWQKLVSELAPGRVEPLAAALRALSEAFELSGAQIKNAVLGGVFAARRARAPLGAEQLFAGLERELAKSGRVPTAQERHRVISHAG